MTAFGTYLTGLVAAAVLIAVAAAVTPEGPAKKVVLLAGGLILVLAMLDPIRQVTPQAMAGYIARQQLTLSESLSGVQVGSTRIQAQIISEQAETYILTKAEALGLDLSVQVETAVEDLYPYPWAVRLRGTFTQTQKEVLERYIETNLAIPLQRQTWQNDCAD